ncbi:Crp/Fnr family transcriptional regulator [Flavihumibacter sp. RY-1]|uniref:Crp/Fnr family transcriptional regulator n=1 Tax=Flavihumibacter fluminis TaxID=2909236 RepID=A0ABS9BPH5_9BACT|nr:Crp/Fnr family transcriptional regulator [Flavihumibacter fluminis]MCF1716724.1 Crp/Fnr family transcriptional regulator [Flavihumibacter fluminis]
MKLQKGPYDASTCFIYQKCMKEWWPALDTNRRIQHYKKGELLFREGDPVEGVFFMIKGVVKVHKHWTEDKELIIRFARDHDILGHRGLSGSSEPYPISATALSPVTVCFIPLDFFRVTGTVNTNFLYEFMIFMADELRLSEQRMRDLAHLQVKVRTARDLLMLEKKFGKDAEGFIGFTISRQDLAAYVGTAYETVYRLLLEFTEEKLIKTDGKRIGLLNIEKLKKLLEQS